MTKDRELPETVRFLLNPTAYPHPVERVELVQTHISYVFLAGNFVYKMKKPVNFGFLNFIEPAKRRHFCQEELRLNRRLCPEIYLDVWELNRASDGSLKLAEHHENDDQMISPDHQLNFDRPSGHRNQAGNGEPVEYLVRMVRMPEVGMMAGVIARGELSARHLDQITAKLVPFYRAAAGDPKVMALMGSVETVALNVNENLEQTTEFVGGPALSHAQFNLISSYTHDFLRQEPLFRQRQEAGRICEGHGDLYSANICFAENREKVYIFDCIEFNQRFRCCDVASDIAFLVMDLNFHGLSRLSRYFVEQFIIQTADPELSAMLPFYCCYRAYVRGKIGLFTAHAPEVDATTKEKSLEQAGRYFTLAEHYARSHSF